MKQRVVIVILLTALASLWLSCATAKPKVSVVAVKAQAAEKGSINGQFQLVADAPVSKPLTVSYALGGNAKMGKDYKKIKGKTSILAGQSVAYIDVIPVADKKAEKPETVKLVLKNGRNYLRGNARSASIQITDEPVPGAGGNGSASGTLYMISARFDGVTLNLAAGTRQTTKHAEMSIDTQGQLGYGGGMFTDVEVIGGIPSYFTINLRDVKPNPYVLRSKLGPFPLNGSVLGPIQPSPDGRLFAMYTSEGSVPYVYVFDATLDIVFKLQGYTSRSWLGNDRIVVSKGSSLYTVTVAGFPVITRIGLEGLGLPNEPAEQPSVSPDGTSIAYLHGSAIWRINVDGTGLTQLTKSYYNVAWPSWSPDGSRLVVSTVCTTFGGGLPSGDEIIVISATETNQDLEKIPFVTSSCGSVYWLPS